jgi:hypothetical protein
MDGEHDWRLEARVDGPTGPIRRRLNRSRVGRRLHHSRARDLAAVLRALVPHDIVVTNDDGILFAYGANAAMLVAAREALEAATAPRRIATEFTISRWDDALDAWRQVDPPPLAAAVDRSEDSAVRGAQTIETRTMVCITGKFVRAQIEQTMLKSAGILGVRCEISELPRMLTTQVSFTVTGPRGKLDSFRAHLVAQAWATIRTEGLTMGPTS